jgi:hypothetical protein
MSNILTARYHRDKPRPAATWGEGVEGGMRGEPPHPPRILGAFGTVLDTSAKPIVSQNFGESLNNRTCTVNATKINQHHQSSVQVRYRNEKHVHYWIVYS